MENLRPKTKPSGKQVHQMKIQLTKLISEIGIERIKTLADVDRATIRTWQFRGRISAIAAHKICLSPDVINLGFTREVLRPDVECWTV